MLPHKIEVLLSLPKSLYVCLKSMPFKEAIKIPVFVSRKTKIVSLKGRIRCSYVAFGKVRIGFSGSGTARHLACSIENNGTMTFGKYVNFGGGSQICTVKSASQIIVGDNTSAMGETHIVAKKYIEIGTDCLMSWGVQLMDSDLHDIISLSDEKVINEDKEIIIGDHVWVCSNVNILKGTHIASNNIIASGSTINGKIEGIHQIVTGLPLKILKEDCDWKHTQIMDAKL